MDDAGIRTLAERAARRLDGCKRLLFVTGAGLSAESGLPTYRGEGGLYVGKPTEHGMPVEEAMSGRVFRRHPEIAWRHIARLEERVREVRPSPAHRLIAELERDYEVVVLTQNVDGLHAAAGSSQVIDIHGDFHEVRCTRCSHGERYETYAGLGIPPRCPMCLSIMRPNVVLFEEMLPEAKVERLMSELARGFDAYFSVGTSSLFPYISEPIVEAARRGRLTIEINPECTEVSESVELRFACSAGRALKAIFDGARGAQQQD